MTRRKKRPHAAPRRRGEGAAPAAPGRPPDAFADLTWKDLEAWAGSAIVSRGKTYARRVLDLRVTSEGGLVAKVVGTAPYATRVDRSETGELRSSCTCPYDWGACKHAVAVILAALDAMKKERPLPVAAPDDEGPTDAGPADEGSTGGRGRSAMPRRRDREEPADREDRSRARAGAAPSLRDYVSGWTKGELVEWVLDLAASVPEAGERLRDRQHLDADDAGKVVREVRRQIASLTTEPAWSNHWSGEGHIPDHSGVQSRLEAMLAAGYADEVVALGEDLLRLGTEQLGMSGDEGELAGEIGRCLEVVFRALPASSMSAADQLLWEIDARLRDEYAVLEGVEGPASCGQGGSAGDWSHVADVLAERLRASPETAHGREDGGFVRDWHRTQTLHELASALDRAGRPGDALVVLEREAPMTACYPELVDRLLAAGRREEARRWAETGFHATVDHLAGIAWSLEECLRRMAEEEGDAKAVAAYRAFEFFNEPDLGSYIALRDASTPAGVWSAVGPAVMGYLESGKPPGAFPDWPLPTTGLRPPTRRRSFESFPQADTLIRVAIEEGRFDDAVTWYGTISPRPVYIADRLGDELASAVQGTHPEVALGIWRKKAEAWIGRVKPSAYRAARPYLERMAGLYRELDRTEEWRAYLDELRTANRRRPRMMEVLDSVQGKRRRILEGRPRSSS